LLLAMAGPTRDPFAAPEDGQAPLELVTAPPPARSEAVTLEEPRPRRPVKHRKPPGGASNLLLWTFATIGVVAVGAGGVWLWRRQTATQGEAPKPVVWRALPRTDDVLVTVELSPREAARVRLFLDGDPLPSNPVLLPRGSVHRVNATADGFEPEELQITADAAKTVRLALQRAR
jgi:hypothetical protein